MRGVRRAINRNGEEQYPVLFEIKRADLLAQSMLDRDAKMENLARYMGLYKEIMAKNQCLTIKQLAVNGSDLIAEGIKPGKEIGEILKQLLEYVLDHPEDNTKEKLTEQVHKIRSSHIG